MRIKPNKAHIQVAALAITVVMCTLLILSAVFPFPIEEPWDFLSIGTSQKAYANPDWLSGYGYRKDIPIVGSIDGAQTYYQKRLHIYKDRATIATDGFSYPIYYGCYPHAYYYNGKTYVVWMGTGSDPYIKAYTHSTGTWGATYKVGDNPDVDDPHCAPAIIVDDSGYIHIFYGAHVAALQHDKSDSAEDESAFTAQTDIGSSMSYPKLIKDKNGVIHLIARQLISGDSVGTYRNSSDFSSVTTIVDVEDSGDGILFAQPCYDADNDRVHLIWMHSDSGTAQDFFHAYMYIGASNGQTQYNLYSMGGQDLGTTISYAEATTYCQLVDSGANTMGRGIGKIELDSSGYPHIIYRGDPAGTGEAYYYIAWNGSAWITPETILASAGTPPGNTFALWVTSASDIDAYVPDNGTLKKYNWNGSSWSVDSTISLPAIGDGCHAASRVVDGLDAFAYVAGDSDTDDATNYDLAVFALNSDDESVLGVGEISLNGNCKDDFSDVKPTDTDANIFDHWIEEGTLTSGVECYMWIEFDAISASPTTDTFYLFYDYASASDDSDGDATFPTLFDNFEWGSDGTDITTGTTPSWTERNGNAEIDTGRAFGGTRSMLLINDASYINTAYTADDGVYAINFRMYLVNTEAFYFGFGDGSKRIYFKQDTSNDIQWYDTGWNDTGVDGSAGAWTYWEVRNIDFTNGTYELWHGDTGETLVKIDDCIMWSSALNEDAIEFQVNDANGVSIDNVFVRKWTENEPTWGTSGAEEPYSLEITNSPNSNAFGTLATSTTGNTAINYFTITNTGTTNVDVTIYGTDMTGGDDTWALANDASPGENIYGLKAGLDDEDDTFDVVVKKVGSTPYNELVGDLAEYATQDWGLKIWMPTSLSGYDNNQMTATITLVASEAT